MTLSRQVPKLAQSFHRRFSSSGNWNQFPSNIPVSVDTTGRRVAICEFAVDACWLWSNDAKWIHPTSGQRLRSPAEYPGSKIRSVRVISADAESVRPPPGSCHSTGGVYNSKQDDESSLVLEIEWDDSGEPSYYFLSWILNWIGPQFCSKVTPRDALRRKQTLVQLDYEAIRQDEKVRLDLYSAVFRHGAALVKNCPAPDSSDDDDQCPSAIMGRLLAGSLSHGVLYGDVFHVQAVSRAHNLAYTTIRLPPHQDLAYYESPPGLQLLHCVEQRGVVGGESILVDGLAAAQALREMAPELFEILTSTNATFCKQREGADMVSFCPHIQLSSESHEIIGINWSPPFEGPLRHVGSCEDFYKAYAAFACLVDKNAPDNHYALSPQLTKALKEYALEHTYDTLLLEGDMLVFNNRRMLHGRKSFELSSDEGVRHLIGTYTNMDETLNQYRLLMRKFGWTSGMVNAGNGTEA
ncbi:taurine catabolism dioxygenase [Fragilaria crotonensis]|nr:taurine catabolism dioxygenase [Fragilaria crotonensis]